MEMPPYIHLQVIDEHACMCLFISNLKVPGYVPG